MTRCDQRRRVGAAHPGHPRMATGLL